MDDNQPPAPPPQPAALITAFLASTEARTIPLLREQVAAGSTAFAATILRKSDLSTVATACNRDAEAPVLHGELECIRAFFAVPGEERPAADGVVFFSTHEPCAMCLGAICWGGFREVYFLFTYEETREMFGLGDDIDIVEEVFRVGRGGGGGGKGEGEGMGGGGPLWYNRRNKFFTARVITEVLDDVEDVLEREALKGEISRVKALFIKEFGP